MLKILVVGAASAIAKETVKHFAAEGAELFLVDLDAGRLETIKDDFLVRGAKRVETQVLDMTELDKHQALVNTVTETLGGLDVLFVAHGTLGDQKASQASVETTMKELKTNLLSTISLLTIVANYMEERRSGLIAVISSVAGDRGRGSNYVYGTSMAGKTAFLSGLRNRLSKAGVSVLTIKPGMVDTPMTAHLRKNALFSDPADGPP